ncbi:MAG: SDR family NAD(P)-dependent oxidoreductase [Rouxiella aceris]|uniref:SDR family NAD(P)-dependent oxidoreductase n=1 Tax=Rouxiella aceris TaxID=2703884 RepID=UPI002845488D|nr:SDR family NAD(P)-dependent oxidoreductase [Rouxiella aceris]MDR3432666.1 SDR family NAD(P)-dependent oxidoreductase [Rouxiella aceris]
MMSLEGKKALVTGASRGLGQAIAIALARAGADVAIADISLDSITETASQIRALGRKVVELTVNVVEYDQVQAMVKKAAAELGTLDIAVNNAGVLGLYKVSDMAPEEWDRVMNINARGVFYCCKAELEVMQPRKFGRIINTASIAGKVGLPDLAHYSASKFAVIGFTNALAKEVAHEGITVNAVCPGIVGTGMWRGPQGIAQRWANPGETEEQAWVRLQGSLLPQGIAQTPEDIADMVIYLATAAHVTGQALAVDGGFSL